MSIDQNSERHLILLHEVRERLGRARKAVQPIPKLDQSFLLIRSVIVGHLAKRVQFADDPAEPAHDRRAAETKAVQRPRPLPHQLRIETRTHQRMLQHRKERHGPDVFDHQPGSQKKEAAGRCLIQRYACGIVDMDAEPPEFDHHPPGERSIGRNQCCMPALLEERCPKPKGDRQGFDRRVRVLGKAKPFDRGGVDSLQLLPASHLLARPHDFPEQGAASSLPGIEPNVDFVDPTPERDLAPVQTEGLKQPAQGILRMLGIKRLPAIAGELNLQTGQHHLAIGKRCDNAKKLAGRRDAAGRSCSDDSFSRRRRHPTS